MFPERKQFPCGCEFMIIDEEEQVIFNPCSLTCENYLNTVKQWTDRGKGVHFVEVEGESDG